jgi:protease-4
MDVADVFTRREHRLLLELDLTGEVIEAAPDDPVGRLQARGKPRLHAVIGALHDARDDPRVAGLVAKLGSTTMGLARAQEIRDAVARFASSGKPTVGWAETFGEDAHGTVPYYLATGFPEIWLQPSGDVAMTGVTAEVTFVRGTLDKIGVVPRLGQRHEYKNAADRMMRTGFTDAHREALGRLVTSMYEQVVTGIAQGRGLDEQTVRDLVDRAPLMARQALDAGLVDHVGYRDEVYADLRRRLGEDVTLLFADKYHRRAALPKRARKAIAARSARSVALVGAHGGVVMGRSRRHPLLGQTFGSDTVSAAFRAAVRDEKVAAILFRVDSRGGSYVASDTIWREVVLAREAGKPVVVSMGQVAASGGYFVACPADVIVAEPATLTGSIGVVGGKSVVAGLLEHLGLTSDAVAEGRRARMASARVDYTDDEWAHLEAWLDHVYDDFTGKVAAGRGLTRERVHEIARGRVWTGADAAAIGLVDELGGLRRASEIARERAGLPADAPLRPVPHVGLANRLRSPRSSEDPRAATTAFAAGWGGFADLAARLGLPADGPLVMPSLGLP